MEFPELREHLSDLVELALSEGYLLFASALIAAAEQVDRDARAFAERTSDRVDTISLDTH